MGRRAEGWRLRRKPEPEGPFFVRFRHQGARYELATGTGDPREAQARAGEIYARVVAGELKRHRGVGSAHSAEELLVAWLEATRHTRSEGTQGTAEVYARTFLASFETAADFTTAKLEAFIATRLGQAIRSTVAKELSALRHFLAWTVTAGHLASAPTIPELPRTVTGTRTGTRKARHTAHDPDLVAALLAAMPEWSLAEGQRRFLVRSFFVVLWETGLRPSTVHKLSVPEHYEPGASALWIEAGIDKARFERELPITPATRAVLEAVSPPAGRIFGAHDRRRYLRAAGRAVGLSEADVRALCAYDLRHSRGTDLVAKSGDLPGTAYLLGHRRVSTTNKYVHPTKRAAERVLATVLGGDSGEQNNNASPKTGVPVDLRRIELPTSRVRCKHRSRKQGQEACRACQKSAKSGTEHPSSGPVPPKAKGKKLPPRKR